MAIKSQLRRFLPRRLKPHRVLAGPLRGSTIVTSWHDYPASITGRTERDLVRWFRSHVAPGQTWLDVGAHYGYTAIALAKIVGVAGRVFAFEPVVPTAGCLVQTTRLNDLSQVTVVPCGLGSPDSLVSHRLPLERGMADSTVSSSEAGWLDTIQIARLDWLWPRVNSGNATINGLKIDVQGMEAEALSGMHEILREQRPTLVLEFHAGVDRATVLALLNRAGYTTSCSPIEQQTGTEFQDNRSYVFAATQTT